MDYLWLVFALLSAVCAGLVALFGKMGLQGIDTNTATAIRAVIMAVFLVGVVLLSGKLAHFEQIFSNHKALLFIILSGLAGALSWLFYFAALKIGKVSQVAAIDKLSLVFAIILAMLFLSEKLSLKAGIGAALIAAGAILVALG